MFVGTLVVYLATTAHYVVHTDVFSANFLSWRIATTGVPWIDGLNIPRLDHNPTRDIWVMQAGNGHTVITRSPGAVAVAIPAYWVLHPATMTSVPGAVTAALLMAGAVTLLFVTLRPSLGDRTSALAALVFGFTTPVWSVAANGVWPHTVTLFGIAGMAWASARGRWWWVGVFGGITLWGRLHAALIVAVLGLLLGRRRRDRGIVVRIGSVSAGFLALLCVWTRWIYGTWNPAGSYDSSTLEQHARASWLDLTNQAGMWVAPDRGILVWTPVLLLLLPALVRSWHDQPDWSRALVWSGVLYTLLQAEVNPFGGGEVFYGYRYGLELLGCVAPAFALSTPWMGRWARRLLGPLLGVQLLAIMLGATIDSLWLSGALMWRDNAFVAAEGDLGALWWILLVLFLVLGTVVGRMVSARASTDDATPRASLGSRTS